MLTLISVDEMLLPSNEKWSIEFRVLSLGLNLSTSYLKGTEPVLFAFTY